MHRAVIVSSVLGIGSVLVFGAAALAAALFPNGSTVPMGWNGGISDKGFAGPAPMPMPAVGRDVFIDEGKGGWVGGDGKEDTP